MIMAATCRPESPAGTRCGPHSSHLYLEAVHVWVGVVAVEREAVGGDLAEGRAAKAKDGELAVGVVELHHVSHAHDGLLVRRVPPVGVQVVQRGGAVGRSVGGGEVHPYHEAQLQARLDVVHKGGAAGGSEAPDQQLAAAAAAAIGPLRLARQRQRQALAGALAGRRLLQLAGAGRALAQQAVLAAA